MSNGKTIAFSPSNVEKRTLAGTLSSLLAIILTHPLDTIKVSQSLRIISPEDKRCRDQEFKLKACLNYFVQLSVMKE